jgi:lipooligosaccharide transport system permease protein
MGGLIVALPSTAALEHRFFGYRRTWRGTVLTTFVLPILFLAGLGWSVGSIVDKRHVLAVPYLEYIGPGLLANSAFQVSLTDMMAPVLSAIMWSRIYHAMRASPMSVDDIVFGQLLYVLLRGGVAAAGFAIVLTAFGLLHSWWALLLVPIAMLLVAACTLPVFAFSANLEYEGNFPLLQRFAILPLTLFSGVFFPVTAMPEYIRWLAYVSPLWHGVELSRMAAFGSGRLGMIVLHVGYLLLCAVVGYLLSRRVLARRLSD